MKNPWVIFDADNTLWDIEHLYDEARDKLCDYLSQATEASKYEIANFQRERDITLYKTYGYSACRFARSFEDTVIHFLGENSEYEVKHAREIALGVFDSEAVITDGLEKLLPLIKSSFKIGMITAGERWVQERRLSKFHLSELFDHILIVEEKNLTVLQDFIETNSIDVGNSWMIGDSLRSDIYPANQVGLNVIWYRNHNWHHNENSLKESHISDLYAIDTLDKIVDILIK